MAQAAYDAWLGVDPGFANVAPPLVRLFQEQNGTVVTGIGMVTSTVLPIAHPAFEALQIVRNAIVSEQIDPQGVQRHDFYSDHGGYHNITKDYSEDCNYVMLSGSRDDLINSPVNDYENINTGDTHNVVVMQTTLTEWAHCTNSR